MPSPRELVFDAEQRFESAGLWYGHGTDNARDEAVFIVFHALGLPFDVTDEVLDHPLMTEQCEMVEALVTERIDSRQPAAYLTGRMWFAGLEFHVDDRVLVPRSPLAELIGNHFEPWLDIQSVRNVLEIGTGSGCIAVAMARLFDNVQITATDIDADALAVASSNVDRHGVADRVRLVKADLYPDSDDRFDLIISNPPYVPDGEYENLPEEYLREPAHGLFAGDDGLDVVRELLPLAARHLEVDGHLVVDVGATWPRIDSAFPDLSFVWVELDHGGEGIGVIDAQSLQSVWPDSY